MTTRRTLLAASAAALFSPALSAFAAPRWPADLTDVLGRRVTVKSAPQRIIAGDYLANYLIVGGDAALSRTIAVAADHWESARIGEYQVFTGAFPAIKTLPSVGGYHDNLIDAEKILTLKPDVLLLSIGKYKDNSQRIPLLEAAGIAVLVVDYHAMSPQNHALSTRLIGRLAGAEDRAEALVRDMTEGLAEVDRRIAAIPAEKLERPVYMELGSQGVGAFGNSYNRTVLWGAMLDRIKAGNIAARNSAPWGPLTREFVIASNPEVIFIGGSRWQKGASDQMLMGLTVPKADARKRLAAFLTRPGWEKLSAVRHRRIHAVDHGSLRNIIDWHFTAFMAKACYPEAFADMDPDRTLAEAYKKYVPKADARGTFMLTL